MLSAVRTIWRLYACWLQPRLGSQPSSLYYYLYGYILKPAIQSKWFMYGACVHVCRDAASTYFGGCLRFGLRKFCLRSLIVSVTPVDQLALGPVSAPAKIHCTAVFTLRKGKFSRLGVTYPHTPLSFVPVCMHLFILNSRWQQGEPEQLYTIKLY